MTVHSSVREICDVQPREARRPAAATHRHIECAAGPFLPGSALFARYAIVVSRRCHGTSTSLQTALAWDVRVMPNAGLGRDAVTTPGPTRPARITMHRSLRIAYFILEGPLSEMET